VITDREGKFSVVIFSSENSGKLISSLQPFMDLVHLHGTGAICVPINSSGITTCHHLISVISFMGKNWLPTFCLSRGASWRTRHWPLTATLGIRPSAMKSSGATGRTETRSENIQFLWVGPSFPTSQPQKIKVSLTQSPLAFWKTREHSR